MIKFDPQDEPKTTSIEAGKCRFEVLSAEDTVAKAGFPMIKLMLKVADHNMCETIVFDYFHEKAKWKIKGFCQAVDLMHKYKQGELEAADIQGRVGNCMIKERKKDEGPVEYEVKSYLASVLEVVNQTAAAPQSVDDDIPF